MLQTVAIALAILLVVWLIFVAVLFATRPDGATIRDSIRLLPDTVRLVRRLAGDREIPFRIRLPVWLLLGYLISPIDLVPDFVPLLGYADDVVITALVLRWFVRHAGAAKLAEHWPGTPDGLLRTKAALRIAEAG